MKTKAEKLIDDWYRRQAQTQYGCDEIEIDDNAKVSIGEEPEEVGGAFVQAWVWVDKDDAVRASMEKLSLGKLTKEENKCSQDGKIAGMGV